MPDRLSSIYVLSVVLAATAPAMARKRQPSLLPPSEPARTEIRPATGGFEIVRTRSAALDRPRPVVRLGRSVRLDRRLCDGGPAAFEGAPR